MKPVLCNTLLSSLTRSREDSRGNLEAPSPPGPSHSPTHRFSRAVETFLGYDRYTNLGVRTPESHLASATFSLGDVAKTLKFPPKMDSM